MRRLERKTRRRAALGALAALAGLAAGRAMSGSDGPPGPADLAPRVVTVEKGRARFVVPTPSPRARVLVIVSSLARREGGHAVSVRARPSGRGETGAAAVLADADYRAVPVPDAVAGTPREPSPIRPPDTAAFSLLAADGDPASPGNYRSVRGRLRALGRSVQVYVDERDGGRVTPEALRGLVRAFDDRVAPEAARLFGIADDVDGDGRFTILLSRRVGRVGGSERPVDGFVRGADFDVRLRPPLGNARDMLALNSDLNAGPYLNSVLAHEYTHAAVHCRKVLDAPDGAGDEEGWLDEALAHLVEDHHGFSRENIDYRVAAYLDAPERFRLLVDDYYESGLFRSHGHRGAAYLFLRWCADRHGPGLLPALARSARRGVANLEAETGQAFADLFRRWTIDLGRGGFAEGKPWKPATGPRQHAVTAGGPVHAWSMQGTSAHYMVVTGSGLGHAEIEVEGPAEADLQVTWLLLPDEPSAAP